MTQPLISVIMSAYNESIDELDNSVKSILNQTYSNIEFIIVNDNPNNSILSEYIDTISDDRVVILKNVDNIGLVASLNKALSSAKGEYIARMDADDISTINRLERQLQYLERNNLDMIGGDLQLINVRGEIIQERMHFPTSEKRIRKCILWGNCISHPTWFVRREIYNNLGGYKNAPNCEDYEFLLRVLSTDKYRVGNMPDICLKYRIRENGISKSKSAEQYVLRMFLARMFKEKIIPTEQTILEYNDSKKFKNEVKKYNKYLEKKSNVKEGQWNNIFALVNNKFLYLDLIEKIYLKYRELS